MLLNFFFRFPSGFFNPMVLSSHFDHGDTLIKTQSFSLNSKAPSPLVCIVFLSILSDLKFFLDELYFFHSLLDNLRSQQTTLNYPTLFNTRVIYKVSRRVLHKVLCQYQIGNCCYKQTLPKVSSMHNSLQSPKYKPLTCLLKSGLLFLIDYLSEGEKQC